MSNCKTMLCLVLTLLLLQCQLLAAQPLEVELDVLSCPRSCVCQYAAFNELPIARWVNHLTTAEQLLGNSLTKQATCLLPAQHEAEALLHELPNDLQALILLYTAVGSELLVNTSSLKPLTQLHTLEIRGAGGAALSLIIDEPLASLQHANFEQLTLFSSEKLQRPEYSELPSDNYSYKPRNGLLATLNAQLAAETTSEDNALKYQLAFEAAAGGEQVDLEILPYEQYVQLMKQTRMPSFYGWTALEVLRVHDCQLSELHWQMFYGLEALQHLSLERNGIETLPPFALYGAMHIKTLSLAHNQLQRLHYLSLAGLLELESLNLSDNQLDRLSELSFPPFPRLQRADFQRNPLRYIFPATFWVMNETRELSFGSAAAALELWANEPFGSLHKLQTLHLGNVSIGSLEQGVFKGLQSLEKLTLRGNIRRVEFDAFAGLSELRELDMSHCGIGEISMDALMGCKRLKLLNLSHNNLTSLPLGLLDDQQQLHDIHLQSNQLRTLPITFFQQPRLRVAHLNDNPWKCSCDMSNWLARITNVKRAPSVEHCVVDLTNEQPRSCRRIESFETDRGLAPRCANYNGRSVYYVLRKQLHCGGMRILKHGSTSGMPHWRKQKLRQQQQHQQQQKQTQTKRKHRKTNYRQAQPNSLSYMLTEQQEQQQQYAAQSAELQLPNEIPY